MIHLKWSLLDAGVTGKDLGLYASIFQRHRFLGPWLPSESLRLAYGEPSFLQEHFAPTLLLLAPLYQCFGSPKLLSALPPLCWALSACLIQGLALRRGAKPALALGLGLLFLAHPYAWSAALDLPEQFHHDCLFAPFLLAAGLAWDRDRGRWALLWLALALGLKPDLPVAVLAAAAAWALLLRARRRALPRGLGAVLGLAALFVAAQALYSAGVGPSRHVQAVLRSAWFGNPWQEQWSMLRAWLVLALWPGLIASPVLGLVFSAEALLHLGLANAPRVWEWQLGLAVLTLASAWAPPKGDGAGLLRGRAWAVPLLYAVLALGSLGCRPWADAQRWMQAGRGASRQDLAGATVLLDGLGPLDTVAVPDAVLAAFPGRPSLVWESLSPRCRYRLTDGSAKGMHGFDGTWSVLRQEGPWVLEVRAGAKKGDRAS